MAAAAVAPPLEIGVLRQCLVWVKNRPILGRSDYHYAHEALYFGASPGAEHNRAPLLPDDDYREDHDSLLYGWSPGAAHDAPTRKTSSLWEFPSPAASKLHPTMKPVALVAQALVYHSKPGDLILDPFCGSGTTLVTCEQESRLARCIELDPGYCDVIVARWEALTEQKAERVT